LLFLPALLLAFPHTQSNSAPANGAGERFWLAGRYDGNTVVVYFDAVKFGKAIPSNAKEISPPVVNGFFQPDAVSANDIAQFQKTPEAEHFAPGDRYDLLSSSGQTATVTLTDLIAAVGDEAVGNDSYIGALATLDSETAPLFQNNYYALRRHAAQGSNRESTGNAGLLNDPVPFHIQSQVASQLTQRMETMTPGPIRLKVQKAPLAFEMQSFTLADGTLRYYVRAEWKSEEQSDYQPTYALAAWMVPSPALRILAVETQTSSYGFEFALPILENVVDLGNGRTGMIFSTYGEDSRALVLLQYRDGVSLHQMRALQTISAGE